MTRLSGGCQCGGVRYCIERDAVVTLYCCHCRECQRQAASAFGMSMILPQSTFKLEKGELKTWQRPTDSGNVSTAHFCPDCGVRIYHSGSGTPEVISLKAGSLDDTSWLRPVGHMWTKRAQPWVHFGPDELVFEGQPETRGELAKAFRKANPL